MQYGIAIGVNTDLIKYTNESVIRCYSGFFFPPFHCKTLAFHYQFYQFSLFKNSIIPVKIIAMIYCIYFY